MLGLRGANVKGLIISTRSVWTIYNKGILTTTKPIVSCAPGQRGKWSAVPIGKSNELLCQWQSQHYRNYSKKKVLKLPHMINIQKNQLCVQTPPSQKPSTTDASSSSNTTASSKPTECESTTKNEPAEKPPPPPPKPICPSTSDSDSSKSSSTTPSSTTSSSTTPSSTTSSSTKPSSSDQNKSTDSIQLPEIKLPSREQLEKYFFRAIILIWDITVYLYALTMKLIDQYILQNPTVKAYWNIFMEKIDKARKEMKK